MNVVLILLTTGEKKNFSTIEECCKSLSISKEDLQLDFKHPKFKDGIFQKYRYAWYEIYIYETLEACLEKPIKASFIKNDLLLDSMNCKYWSFP